MFTNHLISLSSWNQFNPFPTEILLQTLQFVQGDKILFHYNGDTLQSIIGSLAGEKCCEVRFTYSDNRIIKISIHGRDFYFEDIQFVNKFQCNLDIGWLNNRPVKMDGDLSLYNGSDCQQLALHREFQYNSKNQLVRIHDSEHIEQVFDYDGNTLVEIKKNTGLHVRYAYLQNGRLSEKIVYSNDDFTRREIYEWAEECKAGPVREFMIDKAGKWRLERLRTYGEISNNNPSCLNFDADGVSRYWHTKNGRCFCKILAEEVNSIKPETIYELMDMHTIELYLFDKSTGSHRFYKKNQGELEIDQTAIAKGGMIESIINNENATCKNCIEEIFLPNNWLSFI